MGRKEGTTVTQRGRGYTVTIHENRGDTVILVDANGSLMDKSGAEIIQSDVSIVCMALGNDATIVAAIRSWWRNNN